MYRYLQVISKDHCQNRSQNVFVPDDEADVEERWVGCNGMVGWRKFAKEIDDFIWLTKKKFNYIQDWHITLDVNGE